MAVLALKTLLVSGKTEGSDGENFVVSRDNQFYMEISACQNDCKTSALQVALSFIHGFLQVFCRYFNWDSKTKTILTSI